MFRKMTVAVLALSLALPLANCATFANMTPQEKLNAAEDAFGGAVVAYKAICAQPGHPAQCDDPKAIAAEQAAEVLADAAFKAAQASITDGKPNSAALVESAIEAVSAIGALVATMQKG